MAAVDAYRAITRELLVRYLDGCAPPLLHAARRLTYAETGDRTTASPTVLAAMTTFAEFPELLANRALHIVLAGAGAAQRQEVLATRERLGLSCELHASDGDLLDALRAAGSFGAPILAFVDLTTRDAEEPGDGTADLLAALAGNPGSDVLLIRADGDPGAGRAAGFAHSVAVELTARGTGPRLLLFATNAQRHLDAVKDALWAADEYAGVRYRDPADPEHTDLDISLNPNLAPLRRLLLGALGEGAGQTLGKLREYTRAHTIYRAAEAPRAVQALLHAGLVDRVPGQGRLSTDTLITAAARRPARPSR